MSKSLNDLHPYVKYLYEQFLDKCKAEKLNPTLTSTLRTLQEQADIYAQGRTKPGKIISYAKAGNSYHNYGLAFDVSFPNYADYAKAAVIGKALGLRWGGDFKEFADLPHFEWSGSLKIADLLKGKRPENPLEKIKTSQEIVAEFAHDKILSDTTKWAEKATKDPEIYSLLLNFKNREEGRKQI
jgi:peptidoglycan L-alanyl-D-glutamate endopeptidase CwlK